MQFETIYVIKNGLRNEKCDVHDIVLSVFIILLDVVLFVVVSQSQRNIVFMSAQCVQIHEHNLLISEKFRIKFIIRTDHIPTYV